MVIYCTSCGESNGSEKVYSLLKLAYFANFGEDIPEIVKTKNGKPYFPDMPDRHFSLSHSRTHVLCALSDKPVGCDIESPRIITKQVIEYFSTPDELKMFDPLDLWVLKESYVKLFGLTFASIKKQRFTRDGNLIIASDKEVNSRLYSVSDCCAAVCGYDQLPGSIILI